jgi:hypothetical protein
MTAFAQAPGLGIEKFDVTLERVTDEFDRLLGSGITCGVWSGAHAALLGNHRYSQDIDVLVPDDELHLLPLVFPEADIVDLHDRYMVRPREDLMELMGRMTIHTTDGAFDLRLSPNAADRITTHRLNGREVPFVAPEDTVLLKAILGRGAEVGKHDLDDIAAIVHNVPLDRNYLWDRINETGSAQRVLRAPIMASVLFDF